MTNWVIRSAALLAATLLAIYGVLRTTDRAQPLWLTLLVIIGLLWAIALWPPIRRTARRIERSMLHVITVLSIGFLLVGVQLARVQAIDRERILSAPTNGAVVGDPRLSSALVEARRGRILARDGTVIAQTERAANGEIRRVYPFAPAAYLAGYYSPGLFGATNIEQAYDAELSGRAGIAWRAWLDGVLHRQTPGNDVVLTIDPALQAKADQLLGGRPGAIILMDVHTGAILAMASAPSFDPNKLAVSTTSTQDELDAARAYFQSLQQANAGALVLRPTQGRYVPGSIFKTVTAAAALEHHTATLDRVYRDEGALSVGDRVIIEQNRPDPNRVSYTMEEAYGYSLNVVFAQIGLELGEARLRETAQKFGFGAPIPFDLPVAPSQLSSDPGYLGNPAAMAVTAFGQGQLLVTPLQMVLVAAAVANNGQVPAPYLVDHIQAANGAIIQQTQPKIWRQAVDPTIASQLQEMMRWSVEHGYAHPAAIPGAIVGGKTGTAEVGNQPPHAWFIGFAGKGQPQYAVAVIVEHGGEGVQTALPLGKALLEAALQRSQ